MPRSYPPRFVPDPPARPAAPAPQTARAVAPERRRIESGALFEGQIEIEIEHFEQVYRLRQTSLGKLILTK